MAWVRAAWQTIRPFSTGGNYVNFQLAEDDTARTAAAYGGNFERLRRAKATYDLQNMFRINRNITPTVPARSVDADTDNVLPPVTADMSGRDHRVIDGVAVRAGRMAGQVPPPPPAAST